MRLTRCEISNFGILSDVSFDFTGGLNQIAMANGAGKTTLAVFIKVMLFGFEDERKRTGLREREKYEPWQGGEYGGRLYLQTDKGEFTVCRAFGKRERDDSFLLLDTRTGLKSDAYSSDIGFEVLHIDKETFFNTLYISQAEPDFHVTEGISTRIGVRQGIVDACSGYNQAYESIKTELNHYNPSRKTGILYAEISTIKELKAELSRKDIVKKKSDEYTRRMVELKNEREKYENIITHTKEEWINYSKNQAKQIRREQYDSLKKDYSIRLDEFEKVSSSFRASIPNMDYYNQVKKRFLGLEREVAEALGNKPVKKNSGKLLRILEVLPGAFFLFFGCVQMTNNRVYGIISLVLALISFLAAGINCMGERKNKKHENTLQNPGSKRGYEELNNIFKEWGIAFDENVHSNLDSFGFRLKDYYSCKRECELAKEKLESFRYADMPYEPDSGLEYDASLSYDRFERQLEIYSSELKRLDSSLDECSASLKAVEGELDELREKETEMVSHEEEYERHKDNYDTLKLTLHFLERAKANITNEYTNPVTEALNSYYEAVTGKSGAISLDANLEGHVVNGLIPKDIHSLSKGLLETAWISMRLAFIDAMYKDEEPFLVLDDPFANLDEKNMLGAGKLIREASKKHQIIYFTCNESRIIS